MKRLIRIFFRFLTVVIIITIGLPAMLSLLLKNDTVQSWVLQKVSSIVSEKIDNKISIGRIDISNFYTVKITDFFVSSPFGVDTLLYAKEVSTRVNGFAMPNHDLALSSIVLKGGIFQLCSNDSITNIKVLIDKLRSKDKKEKAPFRMLMSDIEVEDLVFVYRKMGYEEVEHGINFQNMRLHVHELGVNDLNIIGDSISMQVAGIRTTEVSGVEIENLSVNRMTLTPNQMLFQKGKATLDTHSYFVFDNIRLGYEQWNMSDFINKVTMDIDITSSRIDFTTVAKFTRMRRKWSSVVDFSGTYSGTVADMQGMVRHARVRSTTIDNTRYRITGIPDTENMVFDFAVDTMTTCIGDVMGIAADFATKEMAPLNDKIAARSMFGLKGEFYGKIKDFDAGCQFTMLNKRDGSGRVDLNMRMESNNTIIAGEVYTKALRIPSLFKINGLGIITCNINLSADLNKEKTVFSTYGKIDNFDYLDYRYQKIRLNGEFANKTFIGQVNCDDPNLIFNFNGTMSLLKSVPFYNFNLDVKEANLVALKVNKRDSVSNISGRMLAQGSGDKLDNLNASIVIDELKYINHRDTTIAINTIRIESQNSVDSKYIGITSDYMDVTFKGRDDYQKLVRYLTNSFQSYLPALQDNRDIASTGRTKQLKQTIITNRNINEQDFYYIKADIKKVNNIANIFVPSLTLAEGTTLLFLFNPNANSFSFNFQSEYVGFDNQTFTGISVDTKNERDSITIFARAEEVFTNNTYIPGITVIGGVRNNNIYVDAGFSSEDGLSYALLKSKSVLGRAPSGALRTTVDILSSTLCINNEIWRSGGISKIIIDSSRIEVVDFDLQTVKQSLNIHGVASKQAQDTLILSLNNFSLTPFAFLGKSLGYDISGNISGGFAVTSLLNQKKSKMFSALTFDNIKINDNLLPKAVFKAWWDEKLGGTKMVMENDSVQFIKGEWVPSQDRYFADINIKDFDISLISPFMISIGRDVSGLADVDVTISNPDKEFSIDGTVNIKDMNAVITATNTKYSINALATMKRNQAEIKDGVIKDGLGGSGTLTAYMNNTRFKDVRYGFDIKVNDMLCMNTTEKNNTIYYGKAFGTGSVSIRGDRNKVTLSIDATTAKKSTFFMPLSGRTLTEANFINFVSNASDEPTQKGMFNRVNKKETQLSNKTAFELKLRLDVKPNIEAEIVMDQATGSSIKATGSGLIDIDIRPMDEVFTINGEYTIDKGTYHFIMPNLTFVDKLFIIKPGGWIRWSGDPMGAVLNVDAIYEVKTNLAPLLGNSDAYSRNRINVDCVLTVRGELQQPEIVLGIDLPNADIESQNLIRSVLNTQEDISTQIFFLLFTGSFYPTNSATSTATADIGIAGTTSTGLEFLTNKIKDIISNDKFDFGIKYRPQSTMTSNEIEVDFSTSIISNVLSLDVTGNYNLQDNASSSQKAFSGDFYLTWQLNKDGNTYVKAFSKTIDTFDENQGLRESGIGAYYKLDYDNWKDLKARYKNYLKQRVERKLVRKEKRAKRLEDKQNKTNNSN